MEWIKNFRNSLLQRTQQDRAELQPWQLKRLLAEHFSATNISLIASLLNAMIIAFVFWAPETQLAILAGAILFGCIAGRRYWLAKSWEEEAGDSLESMRAVKRSVEYNALATGGWWGATVFVLMLIATPYQALLLAILGAGKAAAGAINYRTLERAAYYFVGSTALGCGLSLLILQNEASYAAAFMLVIFVGVLFASVRRTYSNIVARYSREQELRDSAETINMLLTDFTEQGSDWLFELDANGAILNASNRFAEAVGQPRQSLTGQPFVEFLKDGSEKAGLIDHFANRRAFRNHTVSVIAGKDIQCWSISAKPVRSEDVAYRGVITDITAQRQAEKRVSYMAHFDALTDLPNRFQFQNCLTQMLQQGNYGLTLMYLDLDEFKGVNDTLGHAAGDILLKNVAQRLRECLAEGDIAARLGGDEFAVILRHADRDHITEMCEKIINSFGQPFSLDGQEVVIGTSIGIATAPDHGSDASTLLSNADLALYEAKDSGRNKYMFFQPGMDVAAQNRRELERDLRQALTHDQLCLHYQPLVDIQSGDANGYEALIRWEHPARGVIMPDDFIPIAEESGLIIPIGEWVIRQALDDMMTWPEDRSVAINLSPAQMRSPSLISTIVFALAKTQVDPSRICLEITESVLMHDSEANLATLHKMHELGVKIALDDFGTGYSSLNYLRSFPFDKIKIDRCFISEIDSREDCKAIVRSVVNLANSLGMSTTAEGVEREDQVTMLRGEGCVEAQGYLYSKAVPQDQLSDLRRPVQSHAQKLAELAKIHLDRDDQQRPSSKPNDDGQSAAAKAR